MPLLVLLFIVVPIAEIYVIIKVGETIGALWTVVLVVVGAIIGARLLSWQGRSAWHRLQVALAEERMPHREILDGVMIVAGGALLLTPGFITDIVGLILLVPPTRALIGRGAVRFLQRHGAARMLVVRGPRRHGPEP